MVLGGICLVFNQSIILVRQAQRQVLLLRSSDLVEVAQKEFEVSPTIMIPLYDPDSSTLFVTGKVSFTFDRSKMILASR